MQNVTPHYYNLTDKTKRMKSKITSCSIWSNIDSHITVTNADGTSVTFNTPSKKDKTFDEYYTELRTLADAYIAAFDERTPQTETTVETHSMNIV